MTGIHRSVRTCLAITAGVLAVGGTPALAAVGDLTQKPETLGCLQQVNEDFQTISPRCHRVYFPGGPTGVEISPDGRNAYVMGVDFGGNGVGIFDRDATGALTEKSGTARCITTSGNPDPDGANQCAVGRHVGSFSGSVAISPDGRHVYVSGDGVAIFDRDTSTGSLTQKAGPAGCITQDGSPEEGVKTCGVATALGNEREVTLSPDGKNVYVAAGNGVATFARNTATGALVQTSCISSNGSPGEGGVNTCTEGRSSLDGAASVTVSPDGKNAYVASDASAVSVLDRNPITGALSQKSGAAGCISQNGGPVDDPCVDGKALNGANSVEVSPDGRSVYVASGGSSAVAIFDRDTRTGELAQKAGRAGCVSEQGSPSGTPPEYYCLDGGRALDGARDVRVSPDGENVYVAYGSHDPGSAVAWLDRNRATGALSPGGCISDGGSGGVCTVGAWSGGFTGRLAISPDGRNVYGSGRDIGPFGFVMVLDRELDRLAPETRITSGPAGGSSTADRSPTFTFSSSEPGSRFACSIDGGPLIGCSSPFTTPSLGLGQHTFVVQSTDSAGNVDASPAARTFTITGSRAGGRATDRTAPLVSRFRLTRKRFVVSSAPTPVFGRSAALLHRRGTTFRYTLSEAARVRIVISRLGRSRRVRRKGTLRRISNRGANRVVFSGRIGSRALRAGRYRATLTATDSAGNTSKGQTVRFKVVRR